MPGAGNIYTGSPKAVLLGQSGVVVGSSPTGGAMLHFQFSWQCIKKGDTNCIALFYAKNLEYTP